MTTKVRLLEYASATANRYEALSDNEEDDVEMDEVNTSDSSDATPQKTNAASITHVEDSNLEGFTNPLSKKSMRKLAHAKSGKGLKKQGETRMPSSATKATLERAKQAKEALLHSSADFDEFLSKDDTSNTTQSSVTLDNVESEANSQPKTLKENSTSTNDNGGLHNMSDPGNATNTETINIARSDINYFQRNNNVVNPYLKVKRTGKSDDTSATSQRIGKSKTSTSSGSIDRKIEL